MTTKSLWFILFRPLWEVQHLISSISRWKTQSFRVNTSKAVAAVPTLLHSGQLPPVTMVTPSSTSARDSSGRGLRHRWKGPRAPQLPRPTGPSEPSALRCFKSETMEPNILEIKATIHLWIKFNSPIMGGTLCSRVSVLGSCGSVLIYSINGFKSGLRIKCSIFIGRHYSNRTL